MKTCRSTVEIVAESREINRLNGIDVLEKNDFKELNGLRVGLIRITQAEICWASNNRRFVEREKTSN
jgi:hypothetical protein